MLSDPNNVRNRLSGEKSPYLLQHADNPVAWEPWGEAAFARAKEEDKPIFLSIGYATCHWCHVMAHESFENEAIAKLMNEYFVSIKVDREERPDIDQIYMAAVQAMTGSGGWPLSAFLTPDRKPFLCGTYFPPERSFGRPGFQEILLEVARLWREDRKRLVASGEQVTRALGEAASLPSDQPLNEKLLTHFFYYARQNFDTAEGGFGPAPKFPRSDMLSLLMRIYRRTGTRAAWQMVELTLDRMARGGLYDHVGGGFHRYSVDEHWLVPHFEKMLYDNALLARSYLEAYQLSGETHWAEIAREPLDYVLREMTSPEGAFYSAQDADSEGVEGKFYVWDLSELKKILNAEELKILTELFSISPEGNFSARGGSASGGENHNILALKRTAPWEQRQDLKARAVLAKLRQHRAKRIPPLTDDKIIAAWNGLMIGTLARAAHILKMPAYLKAAERAADFLLKKLWDGQTLKRRYRAGDARYDGSLDDYSFVIAGLLDLYEADFEIRWYREALQLQARVDGLFWDQTQGGYFYTDQGDTSLIIRSKESYDGALPAGQSVAAMNLARLYHYTLAPTYQERLDNLLSSMAGTLGAHPQMAPTLLSVLDFITDRPTQIVIAGQSSDPQVTEFLYELKRRYLPNCLLALANPSHEVAMPLIADKVPIKERMTLYLCEDHTCQAPVHSLEGSEQLLQPRIFSIS